MDGFYSRYGKRWFDLVAVTILLMFSWPLMLIACFAILLVDGRPVLFCQKRVGRNGKVFDILKFRTMQPDADRQGPIAFDGDPRVTPLGKWIRISRIDEMPQLLNVLRGDMSFVGPRPDVPGYADRLEGADRLILEARPGITGPATLAFAEEAKLLAVAKDPVAYNDQVIWPAKVRINLDYVKRQTLWGDLSILIRTAGTIIRNIVTNQRPNSRVHFSGNRWNC